MKPFELAILSPDNFQLLDKMRKDLIEVGYEDTDKKLQGQDWNQFLADRPNDVKAMTIWGERELTFHNHDCYGYERITLTPDNYNQILTRCKEAINTMK